jgi:hypothetical protein
MFDTENIVKKILAVNVVSSVIAFFPNSRTYLASLISEKIFSWVSNRK